MDLNVVLGIGLAGIVVFYLARALRGSLVNVLTLVLRTLVAFAGIWAFNVLGGLFGLHLGLNLLSAATVALLGLPGVALLFAVRYLL